MQGALLSAKILTDYRNFKSGQEFIFDPHITLLVGDQGVGKSTLLRGLHQIQDWLDIVLSQQCMAQGCSTYFFDTEKMNPRMQSDLSHIEDQDVYMGHVASHFQSHGEIIRSFVLSPLRKAKDENAVLFLDEPESGLSVRSQYQIAKEMKKQKNKQFLIATHSVVLMKEIGKVFSLEHLKWMDADEFLMTQK